MKKQKWETLKERVTRHYQIPLKAKLEWMRMMFKFNNKHTAAIRLRLREMSLR